MLNQRDPPRWLSSTISKFRKSPGSQQSITAEFFWVKECYVLRVLLNNKKVPSSWTNWSILTPCKDNRTLHACRYDEGGFLPRMWTWFSSGLQSYQLVYSKHRGQGETLTLKGAVSKIQNGDATGQQEKGEKEVAEALLAHTCHEWTPLESYLKKPSSKKSVRQ